MLLDLSLLFKIALMTSYSLSTGPNPMNGASQTLLTRGLLLACFTGTEARRPSDLPPRQVLLCAGWALEPMSLCGSFHNTRAHKLESVGLCLCEVSTIYFELKVECFRRKTLDSGVYTKRLFDTWLQGRWRAGWPSVPHVMHVKSHLEGSGTSLPGTQA